jgi:REP element-mobilizing transposase RayT
MNRATVKVAPTVGTIVGAYKSLCVHACLGWIAMHEPARRLGQLWQRNYYEHVIRDEPDLDRIRQYIMDNPARWDEDHENPLSAATRMR